MTLQAIEPAAAIELLASRLAPIGTEELATPDATGRVLAREVRLDRDSPACDVSAMDGFAVSAEELTAGVLPIVGECRIGEAPETLPAGSALRIYTGSPVPDGADAVIRLEHVIESEGSITLIKGKSVRAGEDIRRRGENAAAGSVVLSPGIELTAAAIGAVATVGLTVIPVHRRLRVTVITTGNELAQFGEGELKPWRLRDSNGPALAAMLGAAPWIESVRRMHANDSLDSLKMAISLGLGGSEAVVLTGGVSKGAYDFVPDAVRAEGGDVLFHRLRARPGQPTLGAIAGGKPIIGLPGNPLAVLTAGRRVLAPLLKRLAGLATFDPPASHVTLNAWSGKPLPLTWWRPVTLTAPGVARLAALQGSGDVCGPAMSDGFIEVPPERADAGPYSYYSWRI
ncbi:molybdopterin molybdotransferase MoeA [Botrimarina mediterranea]|uniref:Molybdopterin molybdenumtransferase n=1 Tax=Botrimarina mediterranea TaxID=2528022 RepID=A0A518KBK2_9BACT|nr:molybdopterin molybdotransferase MoeA [Botrimarina mediterranea]QDV75172.1 Molybdopterin molybdenumtransferase [Botrimarina mediterranea]